VTVERARTDEWSHLEMRCPGCARRFNITLHGTEAGRQLIEAERRLAELEAIVIEALGGPRMALVTADLPDLPRHFGGQDALRDLARYVAGTAVT
jgi:hypothetical protein